MGISFQHSTDYFTIINITIINRIRITTFSQKNFKGIFIGLIVSQIWISPDIYKTNLGYYRIYIRNRNTSCKIKHGLVRSY
ncbi:Uncharacterized protein dnm_005510 [Desulfonema magnum]|uniref:Uncharacterized protein n=1 Tax=Desulfonema magnum TaxID=45655 RepID=A0A975GKA9_9BACT|nr:Uncharacterized protein dnm_005510 [Desulfonema magnum]